MLDPRGNARQSKAFTTFTFYPKRRVFLYELTEPVDRRSSALPVNRLTDYVGPRRKIRSSFGVFVLWSFGSLVRERLEPWVLNRWTFDPKNRRANRTEPGVYPTNPTNAS
jgi:hypothetical protein